MVCDGKFFSTFDLLIFWTDSNSYLYTFKVIYVRFVKSLLEFRIYNTIGYAHIPLLFSKTSQTQGYLPYTIVSLDTVRQTHGSVQYLNQNKETYHNNVSTNLFYKQQYILFQAIYLEIRDLNLYLHQTL